MSSFSTPAYTADSSYSLTKMRSSDTHRAWQFLAILLKLHPVLCSGIPQTHRISPSSIQLTTSFTSVGVWVWMWGWISTTWKERNCRFPCFFIKFRKGTVEQRTKFQTVQTIPQKDCKYPEKCCLENSICVCMNICLVSGRKCLPLTGNQTSSHSSAHNSW